MINGSEVDMGRTKKPLGIGIHTVVDVDAFSDMGALGSMVLHSETGTINWT
jgi:hypothetical protein